MNIRIILLRFGASVRQFRSSQNLSGPDLATRAGISKGHLSEIEHGKKNASLDTIHRLATALRVSVNDLLR